MGKKKVVILGGGTGSFSVRAGLKAYADQIEIAAVVAVSDSGGSTGKLRDEFGYLPVGDLRMALLSLADDDQIDSASLRELFLYRFNKGGNGLQGHNLGNLFLTALTDVVGSEKEAIAIASRMFGVKGTVLPVTYENITLAAKYADGVVLRGETHIDEPTLDRDNHSIVDIWIEPESHETPEVRKAVEEADMIVLGPGDLYATSLAVCLVGDMPSLVKNARGTFVYIGNLFSKFGQTTGFDTARYIAEIEKYIGRAPDAVVINTAPLPETLVEKYAHEKEYPVKDTGSGNDVTKCIRGDFLAVEEMKTRAGDVLKRSLIRHDSKKLAAALMELL